MTAAREQHTSAELVEYEMIGNHIAVAAKMVWDLIRTYIMFTGIALAAVGAVYVAGGAIDQTLRNVVVGFVAVVAITMTWAGALYVPIQRAYMARYLARGKHLEDEVLGTKIVGGLFDEFDDKSGMTVPGIIRLIVCVFTLFWLAIAAAVWIF